MVEFGDALPSRALHVKRLEPKLETYEENHETIYCCGKIINLKNIIIAYSIINGIIYWIINLIITQYTTACTVIYLPIYP